MSISYQSAEEYLAALEARGPFPRGFRCATRQITFEPVERPASRPYRMNMSLLLAEGPRVVTVGRTTTNRFMGAPVRLARERLPQGGVQALLINNRVANVASPTGYEDAVALADAVAARTGLEANRALSISTGVIGWSLPLSAMQAELPALVAALGAATPLDFARAIMTTDRYPKLVVREVDGVRIVGTAKGAGMVEPSMATMLAFITTDAEIDRAEADALLGDVVERTFNTITVDGDQSTSDMALLLCSGAAELRVGREVDTQRFRAALEEVCAELALEIVRNGEGTAHVIDVEVRGVPSAELARAIGKRIVNSPLVKTAVNGNDPNVGRIVAAAGAFLGSAAGRALGADQLEIDALRLIVQGHTVFERGAFRLNHELEGRLSQALHAAAMDMRLKGYPQLHGTVRIELDFGRGAAAARVLGSELSEEYVHENADYRT